MHLRWREVTVLARKREEPLYQTPLSISAFSRSDIEIRKLGDISQVADFTPNIVFDFTAPISGSTNNASVFIRGVGQTDYVPSMDPGVGIYLDGVYITRTVGSVLNLLDVERIEILRGPQGTLFGKNTVGGAINVFTVRLHDVLEAEFDLTAGSFDRRDLRGWLNLPISETLSSRWSFGVFRRDGYMKRILAADRMGDDDEEVARMALRWAPTERFDANLTVDYTEVDETTTVAKLLSTDSRTPTSPYSIGDSGTLFAGQAYNVLIGQPGPAVLTVFGSLPPLPDTAVPYDRRWLADGVFETNATGPNYSKHSALGMNATLAWMLPRIRVNSISGYRAHLRHSKHQPAGAGIGCNSWPCTERHRSDFARARAHRRAPADGRAIFPTAICDHLPRAGRRQHSPKARPPRRNAAACSSPMPRSRRRAKRGPAHFATAGPC